MYGMRTSTFWAYLRIVYNRSHIVAATEHFITIKTGVPVIYKVTNGAIKTKDSEGKQYFLDEAGVETELGADQIAILPGLEAFGDYNWIIHNLRLPTAANTG